MKKFYTLMLIGLFFSSLHSQEKNGEKTDILKFNAQWRIRQEWDQRDLNLNSRINSFTNMRTRFSATLKPLANYTALIEFQDARLFGKERTPTTENTKNVDLRQGYLEIQKFLWNKMTLKIGRMETSFGNERLVGVGNWHNVGRSFDGYLLTIADNENIRVDLFNYYLEEKSSAPSSADSLSLSQGIPDKDDFLFNGLYFKHSYSDKTEYSLYLFNQRDLTSKTVNGTKKDSLSRQTVGALAQHSFTTISLSLEGAYQFGSIMGKDIRAFMFVFSASYKMPNFILKPKFTTGADVLSGENKLNTKKTRTFNTLYGSNHRYYGSMDYFTDIPKHTKNLGLRDIYLGVQINPYQNFLADIHYHNFTSYKKHPILNSRFFGHEFDLTFRYKISKHVSYESGASVMLPGRLLKTFLGSNDPGYWFYVSTSLIL